MSLLNIALHRDRVIVVVDTKAIGFDAAGNAVAGDFEAGKMVVLPHVPAIVAIRDEAAYAPATFAGLIGKSGFYGKAAGGSYREFVRGVPAFLRQTIATVDQVTGRPSPRGLEVTIAGFAEPGSTAAAALIYRHVDDFRPVMPPHDRPVTISPDHERIHVPRTATADELVEIARQQVRLAREGVLTDTAIGFPPELLSQCVGGRAIVAEIDREGVGTWDAGSIEPDGP